MRTVPFHLRVLLDFEQVFDLAEDATGLFGSVAGNIAELARYAFHNIIQL